MDITNVTSQGLATSTTAPTKDALGQDTFLQLLVTQLKYQDPMNPMDSAESLSEVVFGAAASAGLLGAASLADPPDSALDIVKFLGNTPVLRLG